MGAGLYYGAALAEAISSPEETVYLVGGANSAGQAAMYFSRYTGHVVMLVRGEGLEKSMSQYLIDQIAQTPNIEVRTHTRVVAVDGENHLECLTLLNDQTGESRRFPPPRSASSSAPRRAPTGWTASSSETSAASSSPAAKRSRGRRAAPRLDVGARPVPAGDQRAGHLRCR